jgi:macrolide transport system ATP-binding/permease protein
MNDARYALRTLAKRPGFTAVAVLTLALGIGANTALFTVVNAVFLQPPAVAEPDRLVVVDEAMSYPDFRDVREQQRTFEGLALSTITLAALDDGSQTDQIRAEIVTGNFFDRLGVRAALGRTFLPEEDAAPGTSSVVVLSNDTWRTRFGSNPNTVGSTVLLNGSPFTVVGIVPQEFRGMSLDTAPHLWTPMAAHDVVMPGYDFTEERQERAFTALARLRGPVTIEQARADLASVVSSLRSTYPETDEKLELSLVRLGDAKSDVREEMLPAVSVMLVFSTLVLLVACANIAGLQLTHATSRRREMAVRLALGASRARLARQLLVENSILVALGAAASLLFVVWTGDLLFALLAPPNVSIPIATDSLVFAFLAATATGAAVVFGVAPALAASRSHPVEALKEGTPGSSARTRLRGTLVAIQVALSVVLLIGAGLFLRSFGALRSVDPGLDPARILTFRVNPRLSGYKPEQARAVLGEIRERVGALPSVEAVSTAQLVQLGFGDIRRPIVRAGETAPDDPEQYVGYNVVGASYFRTVGIPLLAGREFADTDAPAGSRVAVVNEALANRLWPGENPVGKRLQLPLKEPGPEIEVVGVATNGKYQSLAEETKPFLYLPLSQESRPSVTFLVRSSGSPESLAGPIRHELRALDSNLPAYAMLTLDEYLGRQTRQPRTTSTLLAVGSLLALSIAATGVYGVLAYMVRRREREIGIRLALGAQWRDIVRLVVGYGMLLTVTGLVVGLVAAFALARLVSGMLFGVAPTDPATFAMVAAVVAAVALVACALPALRATRIAPAEALRHE